MSRSGPLSAHGGAACKAAVSRAPQTDSGASKRMAWAPSATAVSIAIGCRAGVSRRPTAAAGHAGRRPRLDEPVVSREHETKPERLAVVTGGNRGIGLEVCRQLAEQGVMVILTARNEKRGKDAVESLRHECNLSNIIYHPLDVLDDGSVASLAQHIESRYGKLDILVNNAGVGGVVVDQDALRALNIDPSTWLSGSAAANLLEGVVIQTYDGAVQCLNTNYHGIRRVTEGLLPQLRQSSSGARIVNTTSLRSELKRMPNEKLREELRDAGAWDEQRIEAMLDEFLEALRRGRLEEEGWPTMLPAYSVSKMAVNLYTRILARRQPEMRVNCVHPGFVRTEINWNTGVVTPSSSPCSPTTAPPGVTSITRSWASHGD